MWQSAESGWVTTTLLGAGVGLRDAWETVAGLYERVSNVTYPDSEICFGEADDIGRGGQRVLGGRSRCGVHILVERQRFYSSGRGQSSVNQRHDGFKS